MAPDSTVAPQTSRGITGPLKPTPLGSAPWAESDHDFSRLRRAHDDVATEIAGISSHVRLNVTFMFRAPSPAESNAIDHVNLQGTFGIERHHVHLPFAYFGGIVQTESANSFLSLDGKPLPSGPMPIEDLFVDQFCTSPRPSVKSRRLGNYLVHQIEPPASWDGPIDFLVATRTRFRCPGDQRTGMQLAINSRAPTRVLVSDFFMHRDLPYADTPTAGLFYPGVRDLPPGPSSRLHDRICVMDPPRFMGMGLTAAAFEGLPRLDEMTAWLAARAGIHPEHFRHFRFEVAMPMWALDHIVYFPTPDELIGD